VLLPDAGSMFKEMHMRGMADIDQDFHWGGGYRSRLLESISNHMANSNI